MTAFSAFAGVAAPTPEAQAEIEHLLATCRSPDDILRNAPPEVFDMVNRLIFPGPLGGGALSTTTAAGPKQVGSPKNCEGFAEVLEPSWKDPDGKQVPALKLNLTNPPINIDKVWGQLSTAARAVVESIADGIVERADAKKTFSVEERGKTVRDAVRGEMFLAISERILLVRVVWSFVFLGDKRGVYRGEVWAGGIDVQKFILGRTRRIFPGFSSWQGMCSSPSFSTRASNNELQQLSLELFLQWSW